MKRRLLGFSLVILVFSLAGMLVATRLASTVDGRTALGEVRASTNFSLSPGVDVYIPLADWGIDFPVWAAPVTVHLEPRALDRRAVARLAGGDQQLLEEGRYDVERLALGSLRRFLLAVLIGWIAGALLGALVLRALGASHPWRATLFSAGGVTALCLSMLAWGFFSFNEQALERPDYYASGSELPQLVNIGQQLDIKVSQIQNRSEKIIQSVAALLDSRSQSDSGSSALQVSDLHNNLAALKPLRSLSNQPVFWVGDFSTNGVALEAPLLRRVARMGRPAVGVSGNHDSEALMLDLARNGMVVLTHKGRLLPSGRTDGKPVIRVAGSWVAGFEDPLAAKGPDYPGPRTRLSVQDFPDPRAKQQKLEEQVFRWWKALPRRPDVLLLHQANLARGLALRIRKSESGRRPLAILVGHTHYQRIDTKGGISIVDDGSIGAGGMLSFSYKAGLARLRLQKGELSSVDLISLDLKKGSARARRVLLSSPRCDQRLVMCGDKAFSGRLPEEGK